MKQALFVTENKMNEIDKRLKDLKGQGVFTEEEEKTFFSTQAQFRTLFHSEDVSLVRKRTDEFVNRLDQIQAKVQKTFDELRFRRDFSAFFMMIFAGMAVGFWLISRGPKK
jgi:tetrahydromethanopterin S-methyltransferase subunit G